ncbi:MAG: heme biosynthesis protein HemY [Rhodobacteraceae bacterium HLUCCA12]|nr:MAG: heme biosynthesis protein HemY [Rhodobacteraceae bacterium HLUCCA12]
MLWTILKIAVFLLVVAGLTLGADALLDTEAGIRIALAGTEFTLGPVQAAIAALVLLAVLWLLLKLAGLVVATLRFINGDETAISRYFEASRKRRGLEALTDGFLALAADEGEKALTKARKAEKLLENKALTNLLMAQAARKNGNTALAEEYYKRLLDDERARFVGVQGLMRHKLEQGEADKARKLAEKALALQPAHGSTQDILLQLQNKAGDWQGARRTLTETRRTGRLPRDVYVRRDAVLALQQAEALAAEGNTTMAQDLAIEAHKTAPALVPAAVMAARALVARGKGSAAAKVLKKAWKLQPHPELAQAFAEIEPDEPAAQRVRRFEKFLALSEGDEARMTRAELLIAAEDFPEARRAIGDLHQTNPTQRVMTIMAAIDRGEGSDDAVVRGWLARAVIAPRGPQWVCDKCHHIHPRWHAVCDNCEGFDTLSWRSPADGGGASAAGTEMLPLIIGASSPPRGDRISHDQPAGAGKAEPVEDPAAVSTPDPAAETETARNGDTARDPAQQPIPDAEVIDLDETRRRGL